MRRRMLLALAGGVLVAACLAAAVLVLIVHVGAADRIVCVDVPADVRDDVTLHDEGASGCSPGSLCIRQHVQTGQDRLRATSCSDYGAAGQD